MYDDETDSYPGGYVYIWDGDRLVSRSLVYYANNYEALTTTIIYDTNGEAIGFNLVNNMSDFLSGLSGMFIYQKNLQGDITGIIGPDGQLMASYAYDAYGMVIPLLITGDSLSVLVSIIFIIVNPILYRGYICTQLGDQICYYLGSRFYHPQLGRFMNADKHTDTKNSIVSTNMFAYCDNNPIMLIDPFGELAMNVNLKLVEYLVKIIMPIVKYNQNKHAIQLLKDIG